MIRIAVAILITCSRFISVHAQTTSLAENVENISGTTEDDIGNEEWVQQMEYWRKHPLDINSAGEEDLLRLAILTPLHISKLIAYRRIFGDLLSVYELQAIPGWDVSLARKLQPYIIVRPNKGIGKQLLEERSGIKHQLILRASQYLEKSEGYKTSSGASYLGSPQRYYIRYRVQLKDRLFIGVTGDKDAGEPFFRNKQKTGFDFYSFHFFLRKPGIIRTIAIGDYTINLGQGLVHWQALAFNKSAEVLTIKRQSPIIRPYTSAGEFFYHRGFAIDFFQRRWELAFFCSLRNLSGNLVKNDSGEFHISSIQESGYHRSASEIEDRNRVQQFTIGGAIRFKKEKFQSSLNFVNYIYSLPLLKDDEPYNLYSIKGKQWFNGSIDCNYTVGNAHFFGEFAVDRLYHIANISGCLLSVDPKVDLSLHYRNISPGYKSPGGNSFTVNDEPGNEKGLFAGILIRPVNKLKLSAYIDGYQFPWLKYRVNRNSRGADYLVQCSWQLNKNTDITCRYRLEREEENNGSENFPLAEMVQTCKQRFRLHFTHNINREIHFQTRVELISFRKKNERQSGKLIYSDISYQPMKKSWGLIGRYQYFETDDYESRIYAYENDVLYNFSIPSFSGKGSRFYGIISYEISKQISVWLKFARTIYEDRNTVGSGADMITGNRKTELRVQVRWEF
jgi:hypothetical protein